MKINGKTNLLRESIFINAKSDAMQRQAKENKQLNKRLTKSQEIINKL